MSKDVDTYYWAMCIYAIMLNKDEETLNNEVRSFKMSTKDKYESFINYVRKAIDPFTLSSPKEASKEEFIIQILVEALRFKPKERPTLADIAEDIKKFENKEQCKSLYLKVQKKQRAKVMNILSLSDDQPKSQLSNLNKQLSKEKVEAYKNQIRALEAKIKYMGEPAELKLAMKTISKIT